MTSGLPDRHWLAAVALALFATTSAAAPNPDLQRFLATLAPASAAPLSYVERRMSALLTAPLEFRGELTLGPDGSIDKRVSAPLTERVLITSRTLTLETAGKRRVLNLGSDARWRAFHAGIVGLLRRDGAALERVFQVKLNEQPEGWTLELRPQQSMGKNGISLIRATGVGDRLMRLRLEQTADEWQEMDFSSAADP